MLLDKTTLTKWNSRTKKYYESLGYVYTKMGDAFVVDVSHLKNSSGERVNVKCDFCGKESSIQWSDYHSYSGEKDACISCRLLKTQETTIKRYGVTSLFCLETMQENIRKINLEKYGYESPLSSPEIKEKIKITTMNRYGVTNPFQSQEIKDKIKQKCLREYGVDHYSKSEDFKRKTSGENSCNWKGGNVGGRFERGNAEYVNWRTSVFENNHFTCANCGKTHCNLEAHHILNFKDNPEKRFDKDNGITFCVKCHAAFHRRYGKRFNTEDQILDFLNKDE